MMYVVKKYAKRSYKKIKHKFIKRSKNAITNIDLYKIVLLNQMSQKKDTEERYVYVSVLFGVFIVLCIIYCFH